MRDNNLIIFASLRPISSYISNFKSTYLMMSYRKLATFNPNASHMRRFNTQKRKKAVVKIDSQVNLRDQLEMNLPISLSLSLSLSYHCFGFFFAKRIFRLISTRSLLSFLMLLRAIGPISSAPSS